LGMVKDAQRGKLKVEKEKSEKTRGISYLEEE